MFQKKLFTTMLQYREPSLQTAIYTPMQALLHVDFCWIQNATDPGRQKNSTASWFTILHYLLFGLGRVGPPFHTGVASVTLTTFCLIASPCWLDIAFRNPCRGLPIPLKTISICSAL